MHATGTVAPPRLLLIEDDASIRRFVEMALEDLPLQLVMAPTLAEARRCLAAGGIDAVISDLMLPDGSAMSLLAGGASLPWVVMSAGSSPAREAELRALGVRAVLHKPVSLADLVACASALAGLADGAAQAAAGGAFAGRSDARQQAIAEHFGGDVALYDDFRQGCLQRLPDDLSAGAAACSAGDAAALHRVAHSLKSVLALIGEPSLAGQARALEQRLAADGRASAAGLGPSEQAAWEVMAEAIRSLAV